MHTIALVGGTGRLGWTIASALLDRPGVELRLLVRPGSRRRAVALQRRGAQVIEGTLGPDDRRSLASLCEGASCVVSAVQGGPDEILDGQARLLRAAREAGVGRFVPSDFSLDLFSVRPGRLPPSDLRRELASIADAERGSVEIVHLLNGTFLDREVLFSFLRVIDLTEQKAYVWGDGKRPMDLTTIADVAEYAAEVAIDERPVPRVFSVAGQVLDFDGLVADYELGSGNRLRVERLGTLEDLDARIEALRKREPRNLAAFLPLAYYRSMLDGEGKLAELMNERYSSIRPTTVAEYVAQEGL